MVGGWSCSRERGCRVESVWRRCKRAWLMGVGAPKLEKGYVGESSGAALVTGGPARLAEQASALQRFAPASSKPTMPASPTAPPQHIPCTPAGLQARPKGTTRRQFPPLGPTRHGGREPPRQLASLGPLPPAPAPSTAQHTKSGRRAFLLTTSSCLAGQWGAGSEAGGRLPADRLPAPPGRWDPAGVLPLRLFARGASPQCPLEASGNVSAP